MTHMDLSPKPWIATGGWSPVSGGGYRKVPQGIASHTANYPQKQKGRHGRPEGRGSLGTKRNLSCHNKEKTVMKENANNFTS